MHAVLVMHGISTTMTMCSNDTLVDTLFQLISGFMLIKVFSVVSMLSMCWKGGQDSRFVK